MKIGFLLGSFDPIHIGHVQMINSALNSDFDKVIVVPTVQNPWKKYQPTEFEYRCEMIENAISHFGDKCCLSKDELLVDGTHYSYKVLSLLRDKYKGNELFIIAGSDCVKDIPKWKNYNSDIEPYFAIVGLKRNKTDEIPDYAIPIEQDIVIPISSTYIRRMVKEKKIFFPYINAENEKLIKDLNLYH